MDYQAAHHLAQAKLRCFHASSGQLPSAAATMKWVFEALQEQEAAGPPSVSVKPIPTLFIRHLAAANRTKDPELYETLYRVADELDSLRP